MPHDIRLANGLRARHRCPGAAAFGATVLFDERGRNGTDDG
jgi:hypothetical protein